MSYEYSENTLVQESAGHLLHDELGWEVSYAYNTEKLGVNGTFGRKNYREIVLWRYFKDAVFKLNPWLTEAVYQDAVRKLEHHLASASLMQINEEKYGYLRDGIPVMVKKPNGKIEQERVQVFDFDDPENNHFLAIKELKIHGELYRKRTDIVGFVNGIPLMFLELKNHNVDVQDAYTCNYTDYLDTIPHLFYYNAFLMLSNGYEAKVGTLGSKYEFFHEWKRLKEDEEGSVALETMLRGICNKRNFMDLFENFILYDHSGGRTAKILARNHQYLGVNEAVEVYKQRKLRNGKLGVFWHTQGSGKSYSMLFLAQKIRRKFEGSPTFVVLTDRDELNKQISDTFENCGLLGGVKASKYIAQSGEDLIGKLKSNPSFIFTLIQKFNKRDAEPITPNYDIIIMSDEAHRSQYGIFAENMVALLPTASRIGFTGTPLFSNDAITERTFGGYISVYDFKRAVDDGATVPLYYENRGEKLGTIKNPEITQEIIDAIEAADLDVNQQEKLELEFAKEIHVLTAEPRLEAIAKDFVEHYTNVWTSGKAMFVCLNKVTCVRMYNLAQKYWAEKITETEAALKKTTSQQAYQELERKLHWLKETEMAVVISQEQNEIQTFKKWGLDILPHRAKMEKRELDKEFKDSANPFRIVFVCAMWLTGFDVKTLSCLYLDKPLKAHTLMQTIARANRVAEGKSNGLIVDYIGIVKALRKALADYTANVGGQDGGDPTVDKDLLIARIVELIGQTNAFLDELGFDLSALVAAKDFAKQALIKSGANAVCGNMEDKKEFQTYASELVRVMKYLQRDELTEDQVQYRDAIVAIYKELQLKRKHADNTDLMVEINRIISENLTLEPVSLGLAESKQFDISKIDFELLRKEFAKAAHKKLIIKDLSDLVEERIKQMLLRNPGRMDYYDRYQTIIKEYNEEKNRAEIERIFDELTKLAQDLTQEEKRYIREGFSSDEELSMFDKLFKENLTKQEISQIKKVAVDLLAKVKAKIAELDHWADKPETKAIVDNLIRDTLWAELPESYDELSITTYRKEIYEYIYMRYKTAA
ncbi:MAG: type I restriction endonuclease subunit R [Oscillospiraceae bacterium]|nr:type I restriction endonuclease subunit R [Oscillospiraceae bacterium]